MYIYILGYFYNMSISIQVTKWILGKVNALLSLTQINIKKNMQDILQQVLS